MAHQPVSLTVFWRYFRPYKWLILATFTFLIASRIATTAEPLYLKRIIDALTDHLSLSAVLAILVWYYAIRMLAIVFEYLRDVIFSPVIMGVSRDLEVAVFDYLLKLPVHYHADQRAGAAVRSIARGARAITFMLDFSVSQFLPPIFELLFVTGLLLKLYSWYFGVITLLTLVFYAWFTIWSTERRQKYRIEGNQHDDLAGGILVDSVTNMDTVKYFNNEMTQFNKFVSIKRRWFDLMVRNNRLFALIFGTQGMILLAGLGLILYLAIRQVTQNVMTVGDLVLVTIYIARLSAPITTLGFVYGQFKNSFADLYAMNDIFHQPIEIEEPINPTPLPNPQGRVVFDRVTFSYLGREPVLRNISLRIEPGQSIAFVGESGAGKSTISRLLFRLYDTTSGEILIDGVPLRQIDRETRGRVQSIVPQEPALFNDTIANNIKFGQPSATMDMVMDAAKAAQIHDFVLTLPKGYDTVVGERGVKISGGEKQRVAIARAIIRNPKILLFDEATSSLDSKSEKAVMSTIHNVAKGRTTITIAHRLSTIIDADVIYVLRRGRIAESGTHEQLLAKGGVYNSLWQIQSRAPTRQPLLPESRSRAETLVDQER